MGSRLLLAHVPVTNTPAITDVFHTGEWQEKIIVKEVSQKFHVKLILMYRPGSMGVPPMQ